MTLRCREWKWGASLHTLERGGEFILRDEILYHSALWLSLLRSCLFSCFYIFDRLVHLSVLVTLIVILICIFLNINEMKQLLTALFSIGIFSSEDFRCKSLLRTFSLDTSLFLIDL